jgi:putative membrane protein
MADAASGGGTSTDPSRRTELAAERTLLAWWRTGIAAAAVALAVGGVLPKLSQVPRERALALGVGYGILALVFILGGSLRDNASRKALRAGSFSQLPIWTIIVITVYASVLVILTVVALF